MRSNQKFTPPPVPPRPSKTVVAEALAKSRRISPVRALFAHPLTAGDATKELNSKPVVPVRAAPPPPINKPKPSAQQVVKSFSSAMVFNPKVRNIEESNKVVRSVSDCESRTVVYQSSNVKTSKIEVNLARKNSESTKNERNKVVNVENCVKINTKSSLSNEEKKDVFPISSQSQNVNLARKPSVKNSEQNTEILVEKNQIKVENCLKINTESSVNNEGKKDGIPTSSQPQNVNLARKSSMKNSENIKNEINRVAIPVENCVKINNESSVNNEGKKDVIPISLQSQNVNLASENTKNERNIEMVEKKQIKVKNTENSLSNQEKISSQVTNDKEDNKDLSDTIVQSVEKTMIILTNKSDDANNNIFQNSDSEGSKDSTVERKKVQFDDKINHEFLISELQSMKEEQERLLKRQRKPPVDIYDDENSRIQHSDWVEVANNGEEVRLSSCQIFIDDEDSKSESICRGMSLHGLPPLPKSLSGFNLLENNRERGSYRVPASPGPQTPNRAGSSRGATPPTPGTGHVVYPPHPRINGTAELPRGRKVTTLDTQLAILRREMYGLRQLDLSLLSQLYSLNESIQDFRAMLQEQEDSALSPHSPSPSPSSGDEADEFFSPAPVRFKPAPPLRRTSNSSSANSSEYGTV